MMRVDAPFLIFGHRGSPRRHAENSIASLTAALDEGADGIETDLRSLSDGRPVLFHDHELDGQPVEAFALGALRGRLPTLATLAELEPLARRGRLMLEVKRRGWEEALLETITGWPDVMLTSFDHRVIRTLADLGFRGELGIVFSGCLNDPGGYARTCGAAWLHPHYRHVDEEMLASASEAGVRVVPWSPNDEAEWTRLRDLGCAGVITDLPAEAVGWRARR